MHFEHRRTTAGGAGQETATQAVRTEGCHATSISFRDVANAPGRCPPIADFAVLTDTANETINRVSQPIEHMMKRFVTDWNLNNKPSSSDRLGRVPLGNNVPPVAG
jgi:hypothetical protein